MTYTAARDFQTHAELHCTGRALSFCILFECVLICVNKISLSSL